MSQQATAQASHAAEGPGLSFCLAGHSIKLAQAYVPGQPLGEIEAKELNRLLVERLREQLRRKLKQAPQIDTAELQQLADSFRLSGANSRLPPDPIAAQAQQLARTAAKALLARRGQTPSDVGHQEYARIVGELAQSEIIQGEAQRRATAAQALIAQGLGEDLGLGLG